MSSMNNSSKSDGKLTITIVFGESKAEFSGYPEIVLQSVNNFISKQIPEIDLARKLAMNFSAKDLVDKFKDFIRITPEGPRIWNQEAKLSDKEIVALQLVAQKIASETRDGLSPSTTLASLQESTSLNPKSLSSRLSEMTKAGFVTREEYGEKTQFRITTIGIDWLCSLLNKKA
jgi:hypothetical protein